MPGEESVPPLPSPQPFNRGVKMEMTTGLTASRIIVPSYSHYRLFKGKHCAFAFLQSRRCLQLLYYMFSQRANYLRMILSGDL